MIADGAAQAHTFTSPTMCTRAVPRSLSGMQSRLTRLREDAYIPRRAHRRVLNNLYWDLADRPKPTRWKGRWCIGNDWDLESRLALVLDDKTVPLHGHAAAPYAPDAARIQVSLQPAHPSREKYELFCKYQIAVHKDHPDELSPKSWERFLVDSPFPPARGYGTFHQEYRRVCLCSQTTAN